MKSGVITHQDKDSCSDKSEQLYDMSRPRLSGKGQVRYGKRMKRARLNIWFYFILLSKRFRKGGVGEGRWGSYWMRENNSGSSSNWNLRSSKSVFHVCMQLLPKGRTHLLLLQRHHHFTVHDPPPPYSHTKASYLLRLPSQLMTVSCAGPLTTLHLRPYG